MTAGATIDPATIILGVIALIQLGVFSVVFRAGKAQADLAVLSTLVRDLCSTSASLSVAVARGEANDANHEAHLRDLSSRLQAIESELRSPVGGRGR